MTGYKRFTLSERDLNEINDTNAIADDGILCTQRQIVKLLNELYDENRKLKQFKENVLVLLEEKVKDYEHKPVSIPAMQPLSFDIDMDKSLSVDELQRVIEQTVKKGYKINMD